LVARTMLEDAEMVRGRAGPRLPITVVIPVFNEGERITDAVRSAAEWVEEVIVVDGGSDDDTVARARAAGATVHVLATRSIGTQRNLGASVARNAWVFALDTDERASGELREELTLQVNLRIEEEVTKTLHLVAGLYTRLGHTIGEDPELREMLRPLDPARIERDVTDQLEESIPRLHLGPKPKVTS